MPREVKRVAVLCSNEVRDGLHMMVASHRIYNEGFSVTTFHDRLHELADWFFPHTFQKYPSIEKLQEVLADYDMLILQHDSSERTKQLKKWHREGMLAPLSVFYPLYHKRVHPPLERLDRVFDQRCSMVENVALAVSSLLNIYYHSKNNGLCPPLGLEHRKHRKRVLIQSHPLFEEKFTKISQAIQNFGFEVQFLPENPELCLSEYAALIYESGYLVGIESSLTHLASNLQIPTLLVLSRRALRLWIPGWLKSSIVTPPRWLPKTFGKLLHVNRIVNGFKQLAMADLSLSES
ncbi:MAG: hypothetical protein FJZ56_01480 [Chlamydiae bacterium]|nr:hypothetical protein [Chlamydiota bacterium]